MEASICDQATQPLWLIKDVLLFLVFLNMKPLGNLKIDTPV
jgi:hypothetical protein